MDLLGVYAKHSLWYDDAPHLDIVALPVDLEKVQPQLWLYASEGVLTCYEQFRVCARLLRGVQRQLDGSVDEDRSDLQAAEIDTVAKYFWLAQVKLLESVQDEGRRVRPASAARHVHKLMPTKSEEIRAAFETQLAVTKEIREKSNEEESLVGAFFDDYQSDQ